jgi:hypothetical protein
MDDHFNMCMRKFLKQVGVTSQQAIEAALRDKKVRPGDQFPIKMILKSEELGLHHEVSGYLEGQKSDS